MLRQIPILLIQHIERFPVEHQVFIVDGVRQFPGLCVQVYFSLVLLCGGGADVGDEVVLFV